MLALHGGGRGRGRGEGFPSGFVPPKAQPNLESGPKLPDTSSTPFPSKAPLTRLVLCDGRCLHTRFSSQNAVNRGGFAQLWEVSSANLTCSAHS